MFNFNRLLLNGRETSERTFWVNKIDTAWRQVDMKFIFYIFESQLKRKINRKQQSIYVEERKTEEGNILKRKTKSLNRLRFRRSIQIRLLIGILHNMWMSILGSGSFSDSWPAPNYFKKKVHERHIRLCSNYRLANKWLQR